MSERELLASINDEPVGVLRDANGLWSFRYVDSWITNPRAFALSPHLPLSSETLLDGATRRPVQWYFDNLLPEEAQRELLARDAHLDAADAFALLSWYGAESAGSVTLLPTATPTEQKQSLRRLRDSDLQERIRQLPTVPLTHGALKRMSLAGAQHKLAVVVENDKLYEPIGAQASTHILKPNHPHDDYPHSVINEWFVMRLAKRVGLIVPEVKRRYVPAPIYLVERFDRTQTASGWQRLHAIDACQLLGLDRLFKYSEGSIERLAELANACRSPAVARTRLFAWIVYNVLVGNSDAHLKNLSFLVSHEGIQPAPFYDLLSVASYDTRAFGKSGWPEQSQLAWPLLGVHHFADINRSLMLDAGTALGIAKATAERQLENMRSRILKEAEILYAEVETENAELNKGRRPELTAILSGEMRCLRVVVHTVIKEMAGRLG